MNPDLMNDSLSILSNRNLPRASSIDRFQMIVVYSEGSINKECGYMRMHVFGVNNHKIVAHISCCDSITCHSTNDVKIDMFPSGATCCFQPFKVFWTEPGYVSDCYVYLV
uniref:Uncharacterized protein n=1 Tax=viral metagenome TaxID=1070528 RepID=A0A6C0J6V4_9ZZZZ